MHAGDSSLVCSRDRSGALVARIGVPLADVYLEFLGGRCRPNTVRAAAYDLKVFFSVAGKAPEQVRAADVLAFITAQRTGQVAGQGALRRIRAAAGRPHDKPPARTLLPVVARIATARQCLQATPTRRSVALERIRAVHGQSRTTTPR